MPKEIRNPNNAQIGAFFGFAPFGFPSDFGIRYSDLDGGESAASGAPGSSFSNFLASSMSLAG